MDSLKITPEIISVASYDELIAHRKVLVADQLTMEIFFEQFLKGMGYHDLRETNLDTPEWSTYRMMTEHYDRIDSLVRSTNYYLGKHPQHSRLQKLKRVLPSHRAAGARQKPLAHGSGPGLLSPAHA